MKTEVEFPVRVVAGLVAQDGCYLVARRGPSAARANKWEFPGGKVEEGESDEAALGRELQEELGIEVEVGEFVGEVRHAYPEVSIHLLLYRCDVVFGEPQLREHAELCWTTPHELPLVDWAPADQVLYAKIPELAGYSGV